MKRPTAVIDQVWINRAHEAFRASIGAGDYTKVMAAWLQEAGIWPATLTLDSAVTKFRHCVNGTHGERFRTLELIALSVRFGLDDLLKFWATSAGYRLVPVPDAEFDAQLVAGFDARLTEIAKSMEDLTNIRALMQARNEHDEREAARSGGASVGNAMFSKEGPLW